MPSAQQPASEILLRHGEHAVTVRASLRVAVALENLAGGIAAVWDEVARQKLSALHTVIRLSATDRQEAERLLAYAATHPLASFVHNAQAACLALMVAMLAPAQGEATPSEPATDPIPLSQFFTELFSRATSWLHWPPSEVWNASVSEIVTALEAQAERELRRAGIPTDTAKGGDVYAKERLQQIEDQGFDPAFDREALRNLKAKLA